MTPQEIAIDAIKKSFELKAQGHDLFVELAPHCDLITIRLSVGGWKPNNDTPFWNIWYDNKNCERVYRTTLAEIDSLVGCPECGAELTENHCSVNCTKRGV